MSCGLLVRLAAKKATEMVWSPFVYLIGSLSYTGAWLVIGIDLNFHSPYINASAVHAGTVHAEMNILLSVINRNQPLFQATHGFQLTFG